VQTLFEPGQVQGVDGRVDVGERREQKLRPGLAQALGARPVELAQAALEAVGARLEGLGLGQIAVGGPFAGFEPGGGHTAGLDVALGGPGEHGAGQLVRRGLLPHDPPVVDLSEHVLDDLGLEPQAVEELGVGGVQVVQVELAKDPRQALQHEHGRAAAGGVERVPEQGVRTVVGLARGRLAQALRNASSGPRKRLSGDGIAVSVFGVRGIRLTPGGGLAGYQRRRRIAALDCNEARPWALSGPPHRSGDREMATTPDLKPTACILCSQNCGLQVAVEDGHLTRIRGDRAHPVSRGYTCEKALRLDHYQNAAGRLDTPLRRRPDGSFEAIDWDTAIGEVAARLGAVRDAHGGASIFYFGGGGQGNHLGGGYGRATRAALGMKYASNALAQEKTGEFWVDGQLFGRPRCHTAPDFEHAEVAVFVGKNPWQSHGFPRARVTLKAIAADPARALIVIDPRRTETAELADIHLQVRPGTDAYVLAAMLAVLVEEELFDDGFIQEHTTDFETVQAAVEHIDVAEYCARAGVSEALVRQATRRIAAAESVSMLEDLGIQQAPHSTLNSYLEKLLYLVTGNFGVRGGMNIHSRFVSLGGGGGGGGANAGSPVGGHRIISGLIPCNVIPDEILTDHPRRFRAMIVESGNPAHSLADSPRMREALRALECLVVIDIAMTETARLADYVLPAASQFEKWEMTFFNLEFPHNACTCGRPCCRRGRARCPRPRSTGASCGRSAPTRTRIWRRCTPPPRSSPSRGAGPSRWPSWARWRCDRR
jgi:formylmethanofuran dehydrogenase subunit B